MKVVIPVAGVGTRLRPHTYSMPKPLLHVAGRPIVAHLLDPVVKLNPEEVIFVTGFRGPQIERYVRENFTFKAKFVRQDELLGLGYALNLAIANLDHGELLVVLGDTIVDCDLSKFVAAGDYVLGVRKVEDPRRFGIADIKDGRVTRLEEKPAEPTSDMAIIGLYYFRDLAQLKDALDTHIRSGKKTRGEIQFTDALQHMIQQGISFVPYEVDGWYDCGKRETLLSTNKHLVATIDQRPEKPGVVVVPPVYIHPDSIVESSVIGPNVSISAGSEVRRSIIRNSIIGANTTVENMVLTDSLVGHDANLLGTVQTVNVGDSSEISGE
ncbi:MAG: NTP transferase domain-containing protein, partial [candidate division Zixibacteria bacterium]|nr:NTP transferase domain-containing protein [candidate division Zixibacteria bacterium]